MLNIPVHINKAITHIGNTDTHIHIMRDTMSAHTHKASKLKSLQAKVMNKKISCFTFLGNRRSEECWIYVILKASISASFPRT